MSQGTSPRTKPLDEYLRVSAAKASELNQDGRFSLHLVEAREGAVADSPGASAQLVHPQFGLLQSSLFEALHLAVAPILRDHEWR